MRLLFTGILILNTLGAFCQYNFYFGNIHSHSAYSDGNKDSTASGYYNPGGDYYFAKGSYRMDFLGISEHNHYSSANNPGMHVAHFSMGLYQSDTANNNGTFVAMYGTEWGTISQGGHVVTYGVPLLIGWESGSGGWGVTNNYDIFCARGNFASYWPIVKSYPTAFCTLAHPQTNDFGNLLDAAAYNADTDSVVAGLAIRSGNANSTTTNYTDPAATSYEARYLRALAKGYHLGPNIDHDNHYTTFGRTNKGRTVVLSSVLHRDSIMAAFKANRFYASDDWNAQVNFTINGNFIGSTFNTNNNSNISVTISDPDFPGDPNDNTNKIEIYYGIAGSGSNATILTSNTSSNNLTYSHASSVELMYYYFAKITQTGGDIIWTAPIWVYRNAVVVPITLISFTGAQQAEKIKLNWITAQELNADYFEVEHSVDGNRFVKTAVVFSRYQNSSSPTGYEFFHLSPVKGINFYRLKQVDKDGNYKYSEILPVLFSQSVVKEIRINPNPVMAQLNLLLTVSENATLTSKIYTSEGREVKQFTTTAGPGKNTLSTDVSNLAPGTYIVVIINNNERVAETKFVKQ